MRGKKYWYVAVLVMVLAVLCAFGMDTNIGDVVTVFDNKVIPADDIVLGDAITVFGNLEVRGTVRGDVVAIFGNVELYGTVDKDVVAIFGNVDVHKGATVEGDAVGVFGSVNKAEGALIKGEAADTKVNIVPKDFELVPNMSFASIFGMMIMYGFACLVVAIVPERIRPMVQSSQYGIGRHIVIGLLILLILILLIPILFITIIGIIPALLLLLAFGIIAFMSSTAVYIALGEKIAAAVEGRNAVYIHLLIGVVVVNSLSIIPFLGGLASAAVFLIGLGVAFETRVGGLLARKKAVG